MPLSPVISHLVFEFQVLCTSYLPPQPSNWIEISFNPYQKDHFTPTFNLMLLNIKNYRQPSESLNIWTILWKLYQPPYSSVNGQFNKKNHKNQYKRYFNQAYDLSAAEIKSWHPHIKRFRAQYTVVLVWVPAHKRI